MLYEFPKLVHQLSLERVGMKIDYQILDEKKALSQEMLKLCARLDRKLENSVGLVIILTAGKF